MTTTNTKEQLISKTKEYREALQNQVTHIGEDLQGTARKAVFVIGAVIAAAAIIKILSPKRPKIAKDAKNEALTLIQEPESPIISMIKSAIMTFLLNMARERIISFLDEINHRHAEAAKGNGLQND